MTVSEYVHCAAVGSGVGGNSSFRISANISSQSLSIFRSLCRLYSPLNNKSRKIEAKRSEKIEAKSSETKRKMYLLVSRNEAKRKRNGFCLASFRFEAKKNKK